MSEIWIGMLAVFIAVCAIWIALQQRDRVNYLHQRLNAVKEQLGRLEIKIINEKAKR